MKSVGSKVLFMASATFALSPVPIPVPVPVPVNCVQANTEYAPLDMWGTSRSVEVNADACQARCQAVAGCATFSFWPADGGCHLQDQYATKIFGSNAVSGPAFCLNYEIHVPQLQCDTNKYCGSCMTTPGCLWDSNWGVCREEAACDYTEAHLPRAVPYAVGPYPIPIDEQPATNTVCFRTYDQCFTNDHSNIIIANPEADRCSKVQSCSECILYEGCVYDHYRGSCTTYEHNMQCESYYNPQSQFTCYMASNCF